MNEKLLAPLFAVALAACSGASDQLVDEPRADAGDIVSSSAPTGASSGSTGAPADDAGGSSTASSGGQPASGGSSGSNGQGGGDDAGPVSTGTGPGGGNIDAGPAPMQCPAGGTMQTMAGGSSPSDATPFDTVACGTLSPNESYFWTFHLPQSATKFGLSFTGGIQIELTLDGKTFDVVPGANLPFRTHDPYLLKIAPSGNTSESYVVEVIEN